MINEDNKLQVVIIGEHPYNNSGFGRLCRNISQTIHDNNCIDLKMVIGIDCWSDKPETLDYPVINAKFDQEEKYQKDNIYGKVTLSNVLAYNDNIDIVICLGDPWQQEHISHLKKLYPNVHFVYYCPIESESMPKYVMNAAQTITNKIVFKDILESFDNIIPYSKHAYKTICDQILGHSRTVSDPVYHKIHPIEIEENNSSEFIKRFEEKIGDKFVIGTVSRNNLRKDIESMIFAVERCLDYHKETHGKFYLYLHVPYNDTKGVAPFDFDQIFYQLPDVVREHIVFTEDIYPNAFVSDTGSNAVKKGITDNELYDLITRFNIYLSCSVAEGFGYPLAEASYLGVPVLFNNTSTPGELYSKINPDSIISTTRKTIIGHSNNMIVNKCDYEVLSYLIQDYVLNNDKYLEFASNKNIQKYVRDNLVYDKDNKNNDFIEAILSKYPDEYNLEKMQPEIEVSISHPDSLFNDIVHVSSTFCNFKHKLISPIATMLPPHIEHLHIKYDPDFNDISYILNINRYYPIKPDTGILSIYLYGNIYAQLVDQTIGILEQNKSKYRNIVIFADINIIKSYFGDDINVIDQHEQLSDDKINITCVNIEPTYAIDTTIQSYDNNIALCLPKKPYPTMKEEVNILTKKIIDMYGKLYLITPDNVRDVNTDTITSLSFNDYIYNKDIDIIIPLCNEPDSFICSCIYASYISKQTIPILINHNKPIQPFTDIIKNGYTIHIDTSNNDRNMIMEYLCKVIDILDNEDEIYEVRQNLLSGDKTT